MSNVEKSLNFKLKDQDAIRFTDIKAYLETKLKTKVSDPFVCRFLVNNFDLPKIEVSS